MHFFSWRKCTDFFIKFLYLFGKHTVHDKIHQEFTKLCTYLQLIRSEIYVARVAKVNSDFCPGAQCRHIEYSDPVSDPVSNLPLV